MKHILTTALLFISVYTYAQTHRFTPDWKVGTKKTVVAKNTSKKFKNGELVEEEENEIDYEIEVIENKKDYTRVNVHYENIVLLSAFQFHEALGQEIENAQDLELIYKINKSTGEYTLENWQEVQQFVNDNMQLVENVVEEKFPDLKLVLGLAFSTIKMSFQEQASIQEYFDTEVGFLFVPFGKDFKTGETITTTKIDQNPFQPGSQLSTDTHYRLKSIDKKAKSCVIEQEVVMNLEEFKAMMKSLAVQFVKGMMEQMAPDSVDTEKMKEIEELENFEFEMDVTNKTTYQFDTKSAWITSAESNSRVVTTEPDGGKTEKTEVSIVTVK